MRNVYLLYLAAADYGIRRMVMPLGPLIVASAIRKSPRFGRDDLVFLCDSFKDVLEKAGRFKNDRVHFLASSMQVIRGVNAGTNIALSRAAALKSRYPNVFTGVGGPDVSLNGDDYRGRFDLVFQGEVGAVDPVEVIRSGAPFFQAPPADLDGEPLDYGLLSGKKHLSGSIQTARGCPHDCDFCNIGHIYGRGARFLDPGLLEERLEALARIHRGFVIVGDDNFAGGLEDRQRAVLEVMVRFQERRHHPFLFAVQASLKASRHPDILRMMAKARVAAAFIGVESPSVEVLAAARKRHNLGPPAAVQVEAFTRAGILPYVSLILGMDGEAGDAGTRVRELLDACRTPFMMLNLITPAVGSKYRARAEAENRILDHPLYFRYNLMPVKAGRPYAAVMRDYIDIVRWFYSDRRLFAFCDHVERLTEPARSHWGRDESFLRQSTAFVLKILAIYLGLCLRTRSLSGFLHLFKMIGRSRNDFLYGLLVRGVAVGVKSFTVPGNRVLYKGLEKIRSAGLYPYERKSP